MDDTVVGIYQKQPDEEEEFDEALCGQLESCTQFRKFLQISEDKFDAMVEEPVRKGVFWTLYY